MGADGIRTHGGALPPLPHRVAVGKTRLPYQSVRTRRDLNSRQASLHRSANFYAPSGELLPGCRSFRSCPARNIITHQRRCCCPCRRDNARLHERPSHRVFASCHGDDSAHPKSPGSVRMTMAPQSPRNPPTIPLPVRAKFFRSIFTSGEDRDVLIAQCRFRQHLDRPASVTRYPSGLDTAWQGRVIPRLGSGCRGRI